MMTLAPLIIFLAFILILTKSGGARVGSGGESR